MSVEDGLACLSWKTPKVTPPYIYGIHVDVTTSKRVEVGIRLTCDRPIYSVECEASTDGVRVISGEPANFPESTVSGRPSKSWLFSIQNLPSQRNLRLSADLLSMEPMELVSVETIKAGEIERLKR